MATDATGTPTSLGIPKYNTSVDAPSGLGFNAAMDSIDTLLAARVTKPAGIASGEVPVWNGSAFVRSSVTPISGMWSVLDDQTRGTDAPLTLTAPAGTYRAFRVMGSFRGVGAVTSEAAFMRVNGDSSSIYTWETLRGTGAAASAASSGGATSFIALDQIYGASAVANHFSPVMVDIPFPSDTSRFKSVTVQSGEALTGPGAAVVAGTWASTVAITTLVFGNNATGSLKTGSRAVLLGLV